MFPSLADASKIEQDKKEDKVGGWLVTLFLPFSKNNNFRTKSGSSSAGPARTWGGASSGPPPSVAREKENALAAAKVYLYFVSFFHNSFIRLLLLLNLLESFHVLPQLLNQSSRKPVVPLTFLLILEEKIENFPFSFIFFGFFSSFMFMP